MASYVHCGTCGRAYDAAALTRCPGCRPTVEARVAAALEEIAAALGEAAPAERARLRDVLRVAPALELVRVGPAPEPVSPPSSARPLWRELISVAREMLVRTRYRFAR